MTGLRRAACVLLGLGAAFAILEGALRAGWPQVFPPHPPGMFALDDGIGRVLVPGFVGELKAAEFAVPVRINSLGLRGPEPRLGTWRSWRGGRELLSSPKV